MELQRADCQVKGEGSHDSRIKTLFRSLRPGEMAADIPENTPQLTGSSFLYVTALGFRGCSIGMSMAMPPANRKRFLSQSAEAQCLESEDLGWSSGSVTYSVHL